MQQGPVKYVFIAALAFIFYNFFRMHEATTAVPEISRPQEVAHYIQQYQYLARELEIQTSIPATVTLAVAGLESNWGASDLAQTANNHFGIKASNWTGPTHCKTTLEYWGRDAVHVLACFRKYALVGDSYQDFGAFLKSRPQYQYLFTQQISDPYSWAYALQSGGYATDPQYAHKVIQTMERYQLQLGR